MRFVQKKIITGCESRGDADSPYLTRWDILRFRGWSLKLHKFHRSDHDDMHDHPWPFVSLILWRGYIEETPGADGSLFWRRRKRVWPGMVLRRDAKHIHRVVLVDGKPAITLVLTGPRVRDWGFHTWQGWESFKDYFRRLGC